MRTEWRSTDCFRLLAIVGFCIVAAVGVSVGFESVLAAQEAEADENAGLMAARGRITFRIYCENCHGPQGAGNGAIAEWLKVPPTDLTTVAAANDGVFPAERLVAVIDGRNSTAGHVRKGSRDMPIWGEIFRDSMSLSPPSDEEPEDRAERKIKELVAFISTLQPIE